MRVISLLIGEEAAGEVERVEEEVITTKTQ